MSNSNSTEPNGSQWENPYLHLSREDARLIVNEFFCQLGQKTKAIILWPARRIKNFVKKHKKTLKVIGVLIVVLAVMGITYRLSQNDGDTKGYTRGYDAGHWDGYSQGYSAGKDDQAWVDQQTRTYTATPTPARTPVTSAPPSSLPTTDSRTSQSSSPTTP